MTYSLFPSISFNAPLSGDVSQNIEPRVFSPDIAGDHVLEHNIHRNVASYGKQLGKIMEALEVLADQAGVELPEISEMIEKVEAEKESRRETLCREAEEALARLKESDARAWKTVVTRQAKDEA